MFLLGCRKMIFLRAEKLLHRISSAVIGTAAGDFSTLSSLQDKLSFDISSENLISCYDSWKQEENCAQPIHHSSTIGSRDSSLVIKSTDTILTPNIFTTDRLETALSATMISDTPNSDSSFKNSVEGNLKNTLPDARGAFDDLVDFIDNELKYLPREKFENTFCSEDEEVTSLNIRRKSQEDICVQKNDTIPNSQTSNDRKAPTDDDNFSSFSGVKELPEVPERLLPVRTKFVHQKQNYGTSLKPRPFPKPQPEKCYKNWRLPTESRESYIANSPVIIRQTSGLNRKYIRRESNTDYKWIER